jgi:hypothetical protein
MATNANNATASRLTWTKMTRWVENMRYTKATTTSGLVIWIEQHKFRLGSNGHRYTADRFDLVAGGIRTSHSTIRAAKIAAQD